MLQELADGVYAWQGGGRLDSPNAGVIVEDDGITLVDTLLVASQAARLAEAIAGFGRPVRRIVLSSSHIPYTGGTSTFALAAVYGSPTASANLDLPPNIVGYQRLFPAYASEFETLTTRRVSHVVQQPAWLTQRVVAAPLPGHQAQNLAVQVPDANVVFAGALCTFGARPLAFEADLGEWIGSLDQLTEWGAQIVPGVGRCGDADDVVDFATYLAACLDAAECGVDLSDGPWDDWAHAEFDAVNVQRAAMLAEGDLRPPPTALALFGLT
jgi:glyoxylase-like metal-dependent hydrolase (beta-lactamase superfamily II)